MVNKSNNICSLKGDFRRKGRVEWGKKCLSQWTLFSLSDTISTFQLSVEMQLLISFARQKFNFHEDPLTQENEEECPEAWKE